MKIEFSTGNAAFGYDDPDCGNIWGDREVIRILKEIITKIEYGYRRGPVMDINGNKIGEWSL